MPPLPPVPGPPDPDALTALGQAFLNASGPEPGSRKVGAGISDYLPDPLTAGLAIITALFPGAARFEQVEAQEAVNILDGQVRAFLSLGGAGNVLAKGILTQRDALVAFFASKGITVKPAS